MTTRVPLYFNPGDDEDRVFVYLDSNGTPVNITGYTAIWTGTVGETVVSVDGFVNGPTGQVEVTVESADTTSLGSTFWLGNYELVITSTGGDITTISEGPLVLLSS